ncbi:MAG: undecaprenyl/decaprenyl-phosphate alpha-N-acetylglucosaminyl 1-phosphate transferase [Candidatus Margulisiibacteriota bacterium]|nr:MAG: hypothetical protein A2X43_09830 [Candidatus Margulisbacteria bacterium GWD2_39_127]OGI04578.1 MAG: hypothetical protein A2X42_07700 [Candidatus Margulisbacteria bacterium GWF2_38_17]OGI11890.1 MAG: hypothetical protein A2X41_11570 [Candidatus Margulisbacteria bacterium GWE2_39_32]PZM83098.1 MAG: undecaprenyl/decaprenyl-phosphate alpha-N-acetylglucosaminyl 1-phosphate transferase [Candidatus Margulisiibacteriota bacterium]HAR62235.1 undecaprenyl-phosphate alpha-N-acetylglucosaminyl 1-ph
MHYFDIFISAFFISLILTPIVKKLSIKAGFFDIPNERKVHSMPIARLGGVGIFCGFIASFFVVHFIYNIPLEKTLSSIMIGSFFIVILGFFDDIKELRASVKLAGQLFVAIITAISFHGIGFGIQIEFISNPFGGGLIHLGALSVPITVLWIIGIINAMNLIDGLDGLASGVTVIAGFSLFLGALVTGEITAAFITIAIIGATLGFLKYNYNPASIFMGDTGSMLLGYVLATVSIIGVLKSTTSIALAVPILAIGIPIYDTISSIIRRLKRGQPIFKADGQHIHHRLLYIGFTHKQVVKIMYFASILLGFCSLIMTMLSGVQSLLALIFICIIIAIGIIKIQKETNY